VFERCGGAPDREAEICGSDRAVWVFREEQKVVGFDVSVDDPFGVALADEPQDAADDESHPLLREGPRLDAIQDPTPLANLHHHVDAVRILIHILQTSNCHAVPVKPCLFPLSTAHHHVDAVGILKHIMQISHLLLSLSRSACQEQDKPCLSPSSTSRTPCGCCRTPHTVYAVHYPCTHPTLFEQLLQAMCTRRVHSVYSITVQSVYGITVHSVYNITVIVHNIAVHSVHGMTIV